MEHNRFFDVVSRINALLLLMLLLGGGVLFSTLVFQSEQRNKHHLIQIPENLTISDSTKIKLRLGHLQEIHGHDIHYIKMHADENNRSFYSAGYENTPVRNLLFFVGEEMHSHWLYEHHQQLLHAVISLRQEQDQAFKQSVLALMLALTKEDTNQDGRLAEGDKQVLALMHVDGTGYKEIEVDVQYFLDHKVAADGKSLVILLQKDSKVLVKKYSLETFEPLSEHVVTGLNVSV